MFIPGHSCTSKYNNLIFGTSQVKYEHLGRTNMAALVSKQNKYSLLVEIIAAATNAAVN